MDNNGGKVCNLLRWLQSVAELCKQTKCWKCSDKQRCTVYAVRGYLCIIHKLGNKSIYVRENCFNNPYQLFMGCFPKIMTLPILHLNNNSEGSSSSSSSIGIKSYTCIFPQLENILEYVIHSILQF